MKAREIVPNDKVFGSIVKKCIFIPGKVMIFLKNGKSVEKKNNDNLVGIFGRRIWSMDNCYPVKYYNDLDTDDKREVAQDLGFGPPKISNKRLFRFCGRWYDLDDFVDLRLHGRIPVPFGDPHKSFVLERGWTHAHKNSVTLPIMTISFLNDSTISVGEYDWIRWEIQK